MPDSHAPETLESSAREVVQRLRSGGFEAYWAGGCVRDRIMGRVPKDYDVATSALPAQVEGLFENTHAYGKAFGVVQVTLGGAAFEVATFRKDHAYVDGRRPESVEFTTAKLDAQRRDFTINGLYFDPIAGEVIDFVGGVDDIARRVVRAIGPADDRFREDYLRMLRAVRFSSTLDFALDADTAAAIRRNAAHAARLAPERIQQELTRILLESSKPGDGVRLLDDVGLLPVILPEISNMKGVEQPPEFHPEGDVFKHTLLMLDMTEHRSAELMYAVLFHDVGKPPTFRVSREPDGRDRIRFDGHDRVGADMSISIMKRLRFSNDMIDAVSQCVRGHMRFLAVPDMRESTLRQMIGAPTFPVELELHRVDCLSSHGMLDNYHFLSGFREKISHEPVLPPHLVTGHDIMALGVPKGRDVGVWHKRAYEAQLEGRFLDHDAGVEWLRNELAQAGDAGRASG